MIACCFCLLVSVRRVGAPLCRAPLIHAAGAQVLRDRPVVMMNSMSDGEGEENKGDEGDDDTAGACNGEMNTSRAAETGHQPGEGGGLRRRTAASEVHAES